MTSFDPNVFFSAALSAGAILSGFCGTFLAFRIQREAAYYRQAVADYHEGKGKDVYLGLTHFTSAFLLLVLATACAAVFGVVLPLLALGGSASVVGRHGLVIGGIFAALLLLAAYFIDELLHYGIISGRLAHDAAEWKREWWLVGFGIVSSAVVVIYFGRLW
jgi:hypothetical protein